MYAMKKGCPLTPMPSSDSAFEKVSVVLKMDSISILLPVHLKRCLKESVECLSPRNVSLPVCVFSCQLAFSENRMPSYSLLREYKTIRH